jgi:hypothetical protein
LAWIQQLAEQPIFADRYPTGGGLIATITDESVNEDDNIFGLENVVSQMQQLAFAVRLLAKPAIVS